MSKLEKLPILFISIESLITIYKKNEQIGLKNIGIILGKRSIICQVLYREKELLKTPYGLRINKNSYTSEREKIVRYIIDIAIEKYQLGLKEPTINGTILNIIHFVNWLNENKLDLNDDLNNAVQVFREYTVFLKGKIRTNKLCTSTASGKQIAVYYMLYSIYNDKTNLLGDSVTDVPTLIQTGDVKDSQLK